VTRYSSSVLCVCPLFVSLFLAASLAPAQTTGGSLLIVVTDTAGAPASGVDVTAKGERTGATHHAQTAKAGAYLFPELTPDRYTITAGSDSVTGVQVEVATRFQVNIRIGSGTQPARNTLAEPVTSELGTLIQPKFYLDAPLFVNGGFRNPEGYLQYLPGVNGGSAETATVFGALLVPTTVLSTTPVFVNRSPLFNPSLSAGVSIAGGPLGSAEVIFGGASLVDAQTGVAASFPAVEEISELRLITGNLPAEYGRTGGGVEIFTTRRGTNGLHGKLFDYVRNDSFDAAGWAVNSFLGGHKTKLRQNEYGVTAGGPVVVPELYDGRNKSFFNFTYNQYRHNSYDTTPLLTVPTLAQRDGDFTNLRDASGNQILIYDPTTTRDLGRGLVRDAFQDNKIQTNRLSSVSRKVLAYIPLPDTSGQTNNYLGQNLVNDRSYLWSVRGDQILTSRQRVSGFASLETNDSLDEGPFPGVLSNGNLNYSRPQIYRVEHDFAQSANRLNHLVFGYTTWYNRWDRLQAQRVDWSKTLGLIGIDNGGSSSFPVVNFLGSSLSSLARYTDLKTRGGQYDSAIQLTDVMTMTHGAHEFKAGFDVRRSRSFQKPVVDTGVQGQFNFSNIETAAPLSLSTTGNAFASFLLGAVDSGLRFTTTQGPDMRYLYGALFVQDNFRLSPKLTLNIGLRYDLPYAGYDVNQGESSFDPGLANPAAGGLKGALAFAGKSNGHIGSKRFGDDDYAEVGPRLGAAYALNNRTVIRGGWGLIYSAGNQLSGNNCILCFLGSTGLIQQLSNGLNPAFFWDGGLTPQSSYRPPPAFDAGFANGTSIFFISPDSGKAPRIQNYSLNIQHQFPMGILVDAGFLGTKATRLNGALPLNQVDPKNLSLGSILSLPINDPVVVARGFKAPYAGFSGTLAQALRPFPQYGDITDAYGAQFESHYNALQLKASKRYSDFNLLFDYTWSKNTSNGASSQSYTNLIAPQNAYSRNAESGFDIYDIPQTFNLVYTWDLPFGKGKKMLSSGNKILTGIVSGWTLAGEQHYRSGNLLLVSVPNALGSGALFAARERPNVTGQNFRTSIDASGLDPNNSTSLWINRAAYSIPTAFTFGNAANFYGNVRNPSLMTENLSLVKRTTVHETVNIEYRVDAYNLFNRQLFGNIDVNLSDPNFGRSTGVMIQPRFLQMALKLNF
jgi:hypothetical protein